LPEAKQIHSHALTLKTDNPEMFYNFGITLQELRQFSKAETIYRQAIALKPNHSKAYNNLGNVLKELGRLQEAHDCYRTTLNLQPDCADAQGNLLYLYDYSESYDAEFCLKEAKNYGEIVAKKVLQPYRQWLCASPANRLRIGFISGDFRNHPVGYFLENMLRHLAQQDFELVAYSSCRTTDEVTERLKSYFTQWQPIFTLDNEQAARLIHQDGIHVLFDLSGHTGFSRLPLFAWKPAPLQISWLGYWATTGVAEIDYVLVDKVGVPESQQAYFTERLAYLPNTRLCFSPPNVELAVAPLPALSNGYITFGCFQNSTKVTDEVLELWQKILTHLPTARLRFQSKQLSDKKFVESFWQRLQKQGLDCQRVSLHGAAKREQYLAAHAQVDFILDTFPYTGGTTTCEALWMGVPTLTLAGENLLARQGASLLSAAGLADWIVYDKQSYFEKAIQIATEVTELATLRAHLREQVLASPLFDAPLFAENFAQVLQALWHDRNFAD
jgi:predicted O-linked N-acetylglucosamine transferase (SPINDLY family)